MYLFIFIMKINVLTGISQISMNAHHDFPKWPSLHDTNSFGWRAPSFCQYLSLSALLGALTPIHSYYHILNKFMIEWN